MNEDITEVGFFKRPMPTGGALRHNRAPQRRTFVLQRDKDISGVSGTGEIAEGTLYTNGVVTVTWYGEHSSTSVWTSFEAMLAIHGHQGATRVVWDDEAEET
jgi:L-alanine-DL-glutamate epimerase-like enolase superfamily enzyme